MSDIVLSPADLQAAVDKHGTVDDAARALGFNRGHFRSACRKAGVQKAVPVAQSIEVVGDPVSREELLKAEVSDLRSRLAKARQAEIGHAQLVEVLEELVPVKKPMFAPSEFSADTGKPGTPHVFVLDWSDLHASEEVNAEQMNGINHYDWDEMLLRHDRMTQSIISFKDKRGYAVYELHIFGLGDMLSGDIHAELRETNDRPLMDAALQLGLDMAEWVETLSGWFDSITVHGVVGNHPRTALKQPMKNRYNNYDWMVYQVMKLRLKDHKGVTVNVPKSAHLPVKIFDETHLLFHGDGIRSTMPGVPWGGVMRRVAELSNQYQRIGTPIDRFHVGHFHSSNVIQGGRLFLNGSVKGPDEFSLLQFGGGQDAQQLLQVYHPDRGLTEVCFLDLMGGGVA